MGIKIVELTRSLHSSVLILKKYKGKEYCTDCVIFNKKKRICNYEEYEELALTIEGLRSIYGPDISNPCNIVKSELSAGEYSVIELFEDIGMSNFMTKLILRRYANVSTKTKRKKQQYSNRNQKN